MPDKETGSFLDLELPGTGLQKEGGEGPSPPYPGEKGQLEPSRDGENMRRYRVIGNMMVSLLATRRNTRKNF